MDQGRRTGIGRRPAGCTVLARAAHVDASLTPHIGGDPVADRPGGPRR